MKLVALLALIGFVAAHPDLSAIDNARRQLYKSEDALWRNVTDEKWRVSSASDADVKIAGYFTRIHNDIIAPLAKPPRPPVRAWVWSKTMEKLRTVESVYDQFAEFMNRQAVSAVYAPIKEWMDITEKVLLHPNASAAKTVRELDELLEHGDVFRAALLEDNPDLCDMQMSPHQVVYDMYNTAALAEIKGYAMMQFSWMLLRVYGEGNFTLEASLTRDRYDSRSAKTAAAARAALQMARRDVYRCDPPTHKLGETYAEVTNLLQGYIENEVDMNPDGTCRQNCAFYNVAENHGCYDKKGLCSRQTPCKGRIINCTYIDSDMWICPADKDSNRRYNWIKYENGRTLGREDACVQGTWKVDSWWKWNLLHCSQCLCLCEEPAKDSERFFSLREATSNVGKNKVVTGVRLIKLGRVFHLQINQGTLGERGSVTPGEWLVVNEFDPTDQEVAEGVDYHTLTYERRAIDLDELDSPTGNVLTGVRFNMLGPHLHLEIRYTPFNYSTGRMAPERSQWHGNYNTDAGEVPRSRLVLNRPDLPTRTLSPLHVDSKHDQYLEFTNTDIDADAAQSTVPFIDIQPVYPLKGASLISGAGIIHRGAPHNGGFIGVKLLTYDYSKHVTSEPAGALPVNHDDDNSVFDTVIF